MGQLLVRNVDDDLIRRLKDARPPMAARQRRNIGWFWSRRSVRAARASPSARRVGVV